MKNIKIYKLSFVDEAAWQQIKPTLLREIETEEGKQLIPLAGIDIKEYGHLPKEPTFDEQGNQLTGQTFDEEGEELTPIEYYSDWAVDVIFDGNPKLGGADPEHLRAYIPNPLPSKFRHSISGETKDNIVQPL